MVNFQMNILYRQKINNRKEKEKKNREEEISDLKIVVFMLSCGALERSNKPHVQSCVESLRIRKRASLCGFDREENPAELKRQ